MKFHRIAVVVATMTLLLALTGCSGEEGKEQTGAPSGKALQIKDKGVTAKGGTVQILEPKDFTSLDPANNYYATDQVVGRLIWRTLTFVKDTPGEQLSIQPDLAVGLGQPSDDKKTWTYKIRQGLTFENGKPITAHDIKYGIQRSFATDVYNGGPSYMTNLLVNDNGYAGPYKTPDKDLTSVQTPDDYTLVFNFKGPQPSADWMMSLSYTAPVAAADDTRQDYHKHPIASGPYKIADYAPGSSMTLIRNDKWDPATDPNRPAYPDGFHFTIGVDRDTIQERLLKGQGTDRDAASLTAFLAATDVTKLDDPSINARFINGPTAFISYLVLNTQVIRDPSERHAIALAINRQGLLTLQGGADFGSLANSIIPTTFDGFKDPGLELKPEGDPEAAKKLIAGKSPAPLTFGYDASSPTSQKFAEQIQQDLKKIGIDVTLEAIPGEGFEERLGGKNPPAISYPGSWGYDFPDPMGIVPALLGPDQAGTTWSSNNFAQYFDPAIAAQIVQLSSSSEPPNVIAAKMIEVANTIQSTAWPILPMWQQLDPQLVGEALTNAGVTPAFGTLDLNTVAVKP